MEITFFFPTHNEDSYFIFFFMSWLDRCDHKRIQKKAQKTKLIIFTGPRNGRHSILHRTTWERYRVGQEAEDKSAGKALGHSLY